ncbi:MAG: hypothetical protein ACREQT_13645 [Candidatus Binataceae bacterium]
MKGVIVVKSKLETSGWIDQEIRIYITSSGLPGDQLEQTIRGCWAEEINPTG